MEIRKNYSTLLIGSLAVSATLLVGYILYNKYSRPQSEKVTKSVLINHFAQRLRDKLAQQTSGNDKMVNMIMAAREACNADLIELDQEYRKKSRQTLIKNATEEAKLLAYHQEQVDKVVNEAFDIMKLDPSMFQPDASEINIRNCIEQLKQQGVSMHPIFEDKDHLIEMLQKYSEIHDSIINENPEMPPDLVRSASQSQMKNMYDIEPAQLDTAIEAHDLSKSQEFASQVAKFRGKNNLKDEELLPTLVKAFSSSSVKAN